MSEPIIVSDPKVMMGKPVGLVSFAAPSDDPAYEAFRRRLRELGYVEGRTIKIEFRSAHGHVDLLPGIAEELVELKADVIVVGNPPAARAMKRATATIPIVIAAADPVAAGLVSNLGATHRDDRRRPGDPPTQAASPTVWQGAVAKAEGFRDPASPRWDGSKAEVHWYEAHGIGRQEMKIKFPLLD